MKKIIQKTFCLLAIALFLTCATNIFVKQQAITNAAEFDIYSLFPDNHIEFYEKFIAKESVVSHLSERRLARQSEQYNISTVKLKKIIIVQHALGSQDTSYSIDELIAMNPATIIKLVLNYIDNLKKTLSPEDFKIIETEYAKLTKKQN